MKNQLKTPAELTVMLEGGQRLGRILAELLQAAKPGVALLDLDTLAVKRMEEAGGTPSFRTVEAYRWATCLCVNEVVVHGIPTKYRLNEGDLLTVDVGMLYGGLHTDTAWTKLIRMANGKWQMANEKDKEKEKFLKIGEEALAKAIGEGRSGNRVGHISQAIQQTIEGAGYSVVRTLVGHGVGKKLHEPPQVPGVLKGKLAVTPELQPCMTLAIEVIYSMGKPAVHYPDGDGWTIATVDGSLSAVFEHTIAITTGDPLILTR